MPRPLTDFPPLEGLHVVELEAGDAPLLQRFFDANPLYFETVDGEPAAAHAAAEELAELPPPGWPYRRIWHLGFAEPQGSLVAHAQVVTDLLACGVWHIGLFIVTTSRHGSGDAQRIHAALVAWARAQGAAWLRLGVVTTNHRAARFWAREGYRRVATRAAVPSGSRLNEVAVLARSLTGAPLDDYYALVARDREGAETPASAPPSARMPRP